MREIIFEFIGGSWDGMNLSNASADPIEASLAVRTFRLTRSGRQGAVVAMPSDYAVHRAGPRGNRYVVANRTELSNEVLLRLEHCGEEQPAVESAVAKRIVLQFQGGYLHGCTLDSCAESAEEALLALSYYCVTENATLGRSFRGVPIPWGSFRRHCCAEEDRRFRKDHAYRVVDRREDETGVLAVLEYCRCEEETP
jgi:hypothetical protein